MGESKPDTPRRIRVDADIKYAVSAYPRIRVDVALQCSRGKGAGGGGLGVLPYKAFTGMCRWTGYGF